MIPPQSDKVMCLMCQAPLLSINSLLQLPVQQVFIYLFSPRNNTALQMKMFAECALMSRI